MPDSQDNSHASMVRDRFMRLYSTHYPDLYRYILSLIPHTHDAQEVVQETSIALWRKADEFDSNEPFLPWARRFAYNEVLNHRRKYARSRARLSDAVIEQLAIEAESAEPAQDDRHAALQSCMERLSEGDRTLIQQRYQSTTTIQHVAQTTGEQVETLYKRLQRIRGRLIRCINARLAGSEGEQ